MRQIIQTLFRPLVNKFVYPPLSKSEASDRISDLGVDIILKVISFLFAHKFAIFAYSNKVYQDILQDIISSISIHKHRFLISCFSTSAPEGFNSSTPETGSQTDTWVEMATSRNFRCHELAFSRNKMVENLKYKHLYPEHWSGY